MNTISKFHRKYGPWVLVTGASSGIGSDFARHNAERQLKGEMTAGNRFGEWLRFHKDGEK